MEDEELIKAIIEKESWEEIIYYIVNVEKIDPWNIDLIKLCNKFIEFVQTAQELDFRIPAKVVFVAALLLRIKVDYLSLIEEEEEKEEHAEKPLEILDIDPSLLKLSYPIGRFPKRQITLEELIDALRKAMAVEKKKEERMSYERARLEAGIDWEADMEKRINMVLEKIEEALKKSGRDTVNFKEVVEAWKREEILKNFVPVLHLEMKKKIETEQENFFDDIWIKKLASS